MAEPKVSAVLDKIEAWVERLPYQSCHLEIELPGKTYTLDKTRQRVIGFAAGPDQKKAGDQ